MQFKLSHHHEHECGCDHCHEESENRTLKIVQIILGTLFLGLGIMFEHFFEDASIFNVQFSLIFFVVSYLIVGLEVVVEAFKNIFKGELFDENFLMSIASISVFVMAIIVKNTNYSGDVEIEYHEAVIVMLLYQIGEFLQDLAVDNSHKSVENLLNLKEIKVHKVINNNLVDIEITDCLINDVILVKPGEKIPLDGIIIDGNTSLNMSPLTGESLPVYKKVNDEVLSGCINNDGVIKIKVTSSYDHSTVKKILDYIESATVNKTQSERFVTKFCKVYTPIVVGCALLIVIIPLLFNTPDIIHWIIKACVFLVVSCPCALVISIPLAYFIGIGVSSKNGVLMKGSNYLEMLDKMDTILFDKTGTLTKGSLSVIEESIKQERENILEICAYAESYSNHPIAKAISSYVSFSLNHSIKEFKELAGKGIQANVDNKLVLLTNEKPLNVKVKSKIGSIVYIYIDNVYKGYFVVSDTVKDDATLTMKQLKDSGIKPVMVSGDSKENALDIGSKIGIEDIHSELLPTDKVDVLDKYQNKGTPVGYVGDGINDAPVIAKSDIGIAMGALGSDAAIQVSDVVIMNDSLSSILNAKKISSATVRVVKENIVMIVVVKALAMILGVFDLLPVWAATFSDTGICLLAILNALRLFKFARNK